MSVFPTTATACSLRPFRLHAFDLAPHVRQEPGLGWASGSDQGASHRIREIVVRTRRMVDRIATAARGAPLKAEELGVQARHIEQLDARRVHERQQIAVEVDRHLNGKRVAIYARVSTTDQSIGSSPP